MLHIVTRAVATNSRGGKLIDCGFVLSSWAGELVCGFRTLKVEGSEETPPTRRIAPSVNSGEGESLGYGAETKRPPCRRR